MKNIKWAIFSFILILQMLNWSKYFWDTLNSMGLFCPKKVYLRTGHVAYFFALGHVLRHFCNNLLSNKGSIKQVLGRVLGWKNKPHAPSFRQLILYVIKFLVLTQYRGSPPYAFFGTWKKPCYMKLVLVGLYCGPLLTLIPPLTRT